MLRFVLGASCVLVTACDRAPGPAPATTSAPAESEVVVYVALDRQFSEPILDDFTARTGIQVQAVYDTESTKSVGLANRIRAEAARPRCDVYWNNEILNTLRLKRDGLLQPCRPANAAGYPVQFRDDAGHWFGFAARARILLVNTERVGSDEMPTSVADLAAAKWRGRTGLAKPLFGTTASQVACLFAQLGADRATELLRGIRDNEIQITGGNKSCAEMVGAGRLAFGLTDTDDALAEVDAGKPVKIVWPDAGADQMGVLLLPNTLALVKDCPHPAAGVQLIDYLLSPEVEARLAAGPSGQMPLHRDTQARARVGDWRDFHLMPVDFANAADVFPVAQRYIEGEFLAP
jgi:iron(III) transport system substrate-binding protein